MLALQTNDLVQISLDMDLFLSVHGLSQQRDFLAAHYVKNMLTGAQKSKDVMRMPVENKTKPLITATRQSIRNHGSFNYAFFSTVCAIIGRFTFFCAGLMTPRPF